VAIIPSEWAIRPPTAWACSRKLLDTRSSIRTGAPTSSIIMYVRNSSDAASRTLWSAPSAAAWDTERDARTAWVRMMAACAATARARLLSWRSRTTWSTTSSVISNTSSPDTVSVVSEWPDHHRRIAPSVVSPTTSAPVSSVTMTAANPPCERDSTPRR
jgi:hypothetical protein